MELYVVLLRSTLKLPAENLVYFFLRNFVVSFFPLGISEAVGWLAVKAFSHCVEGVIARLGSEVGAGFSRVRGWRDP